MSVPGSLLALRSEGWEFESVSPLANYVNEASYILYFAWFLHLELGMIAISIAEGTTYEKEHVYIKHLRHSKCLMAAINKQL